MFYLIINKSKRKMISNQIGFETLAHILDNDIEKMIENIIFTYTKDSLDYFKEEILAIFQSPNVEINFINRKIIELKDLTINDYFISSLFCNYVSFLELLKSWQKFKNDEWKQFLFLFDGDIFVLVPIYNDKSAFLENIIIRSKNNFYWSCFVNKIGNSTTAYPSSNNSSLNLIPLLFGEPTFYIYNLNEIQDFMKQDSDYSMGYEDITISSVENNLIEINSNDEDLDCKIRLTKSNFYEITKEWYDLYDEFGISQVWDLKKLKITYFNNEVSFEYELDPDIIKELAEK